MDNIRDEYKEAFVKNGVIGVLGTRCHKMNLRYRKMSITLPQDEYYVTVR